MSSQDNAPWWQVNAMLLLAAERSAGVPRRRGYVGFRSSSRLLDCCVLTVRAKSLLSTKADETGMKVIDLMRAMVHERGTTVLIVTHDNRTFPFADRIAHMDDGRIIGIEPGAHASEEAP